MYFLSVVLEATAKRTTILFCHDQVELGRWFDLKRKIGTGALASDDIRSALRRGGDAPVGSVLVNLPAFNSSESLVGELCLFHIEGDYPRPDSKIVHVVDLYERYRTR